MSTLLVGQFSPGVLAHSAKGQPYLNSIWGRILRRVAYNGLSLDHLIAWPYDWGGCGCTQDWPWGSVGFPRFSSEMVSNAREWGHPNAQGTLSTWRFESNSPDEYAGLDAWLRANNTSAGDKARVWKHAMAAVPGGFDWLKEHGPLGGLPTLDFPEYSMFSGCPWGGRGANPIPAAIQSDWDAHGGLISGGMPYAEGIYLDINQVVRQQMYWSGRPANETLAAYSRFYFGWESEILVGQAVAAIESGGRSAEALGLLRAAEVAMTAADRASWRWRILYLRALIDDTVSTGGGDSPGGQRVLDKSFAELDRIYFVERGCCSVLICAGAKPINCSAPGSLPFKANCTTPGMRPGLTHA